MKRVNVIKFKRRVNEMNISKKLDGVIEKILDKLNDDSIADDERKRLMGEVTLLIDRKKELDRLEYEKQKESERLEYEKQKESERLEYEKTEVYNKSRSEKWQFWTKLTVDILAIALPLGVTIWGTVVTVNFEKEGTFTTSAGRKHSGKALSGK
jgi:hypothetical protein